MELDETVNPPLETVLRFEGTRLESQTGDPLLVNLELHFRSFLAREPYQALTRVVAEVLESKSTFSVPARRPPSCPPPCRLRVCRPFLRPPTDSVVGDRNPRGVECPRRSPATYLGDGLRVQ